MMGGNQAVGLNVGISTVIGALVMVGVLAALLGWQKRQRRLRNERPPQSEKLLRPAGYSLLLRIDDLNDGLFGKFAWGVIGALLLTGMLPATWPLAYGLLVGKFGFDALLHPRILGGALMMGCLMIGSLLAFIHGVIGVFRTMNEMRNCRFGLRGEQAVAEALASPKVTKAGYVAFHDIPGSGKWNIDHVVVGPGGVYVIETKARSRRRSTNHLKDHEVEFDGDVLQFPWIQDRTAAPQAQDNANWIRKFLNGALPKDATVQPLILVPGWFVKPSGRFPIKVMNGNYLRDNYLPREPRKITEEQLAPIIRLLDERCRTLEF